MGGIFWLLVPFSTALLVGCSPYPNFLEGSDSDRAMGYKKSAGGPTTPKPTWRPWFNHSRAEIEDSLFDRSDPDSHFPDDYYDEYKIEIEGTRRNILAHSTFEDKYSSYAKTKLLLQKNADKIKKPPSKTGRNSRKSTKGKSQQRSGPESSDNDMRNSLNRRYGQAALAGGGVIPAVFGENEPAEVDAGVAGAIPAADQQNLGGFDLDIEEQMQLAE
ncbi:unnamed protein product [Allacma fusca]|uniref:Secreted protein n=1 Tax=Allacma fusca TaxID=39272 RepID=A0A8J2KM95_9HEXA|nr:unnamed protein product [Allacma fusca]